MDLAKIRKKSSLEQHFKSERVVADSHEHTEYVSPLNIAATLDEVDYFAQSMQPVNICQDDSVITLQPDLSKLYAERSPIEVILAGRIAAGCDENSELTEETFTDIDRERIFEFLCFRVSDEIYGINIMDIKEIIRPRDVTEVPRSPEFLSGVISLRGTIISIIDMRLRLGLGRIDSTGRERIIVIRNNDAFSGLLVDEVMQVVRVEKHNIETAPAVLEGIDREFISGIGRSDSFLMIILNLENIADISKY